MVKCANSPPETFRLLISASVSISLVVENCFDRDVCWNERQILMQLLKMEGRLLPNLKSKSNRRC